MRVQEAMLGGSRNAWQAIDCGAYSSYYFIQREIYGGSPWCWGLKDIKVSA
jgi:hypothetical protein